MGTYWKFQKVRSFEWRLTEFLHRARDEVNLVSDEYDS